jgi:GTPase SAR1 family protein
MEATDLLDIKEALKGPLNSLLKIVGAELKQTFLSRMWEYHENEYYRNLMTKTLLHRSQPIPLNEFYQPLYLKTDNSDKPKGKIATRSIKELFSKTRHITILGSAGSGKSTLVRYLITQSFTEDFKIPVKVELRYLNDYNSNLRSYISNEIIKLNSVGFEDNVINRLFERGTFLFVLDGYDEISSAKKERVTQEIDAFVSRYPQNMFLLTSRPNTNIEFLPAFTNYRVCDLTLDEVKEFVAKQLPHSESELADKIIEAIESPENKNYRSFLGNPLLLSMFILTFQAYSAIPQSRSEFYNQVFNALYSIHDSMSKMAYVREKQSGLSKEVFEDVLSIFSYLSFFEQKYDFPREYIEKKLNAIKTAKKDFAFDNDKLLDDLEVAIGILCKDGLDYTFPHRSLQEYFAAKYIEKLGPSNKEKIYQKLAKDALSVEPSILARENFFSLLSELDSKEFHARLSIPLLSGFCDELSQYESETKISYSDSNLMLLKFYLVWRHVLGYSMQQWKFLVRPIFEALAPDFQLQLLLATDARKKRVLNPKDKDKIDVINQNLMLLKRNIPKIKGELEKKLACIDESDSEIIDLVIP